MNTIAKFLVVIIPVFVIISRARANTHGISEPVIKAVMFVESSNNPRAKSSAGAYGLMQVLGTHAGSALCPEAKTPDDLYDPRINTICGTRILRYELNRYDDNLELALAAYNGGPKCVRGGAIICKQAKHYSEKVLSLIAMSLSPRLLPVLSTKKRSEYVKRSG